MPVPISCRPALQYIQVTRLVALCMADSHDIVVFVYYFLLTGYFRDRILIHTSLITSTTKKDEHLKYRNFNIIQNV